MDNESTRKFPAREPEALPKKTAVLYQDGYSPLDQSKHDSRYQSRPRAIGGFAFDCTRLISIALSNTKTGAATMVSIYEFICKHFVNFGAEFSSRHMVQICLEKEFCPLQSDTKNRAQLDEVLWTWKNDVHKRRLMSDISNFVDSQKCNKDGLMLKNSNDMDAVFSFIAPQCESADSQLRSLTESIGSFPTPHSTPTNTSVFDEGSQRTVDHGTPQLPISQNQPNANSPHRYLTPPGNDFSSSTGCRTLQPGQVTSIKNAPNFRRVNTNVQPRTNSSWNSTNNRGSHVARVPVRNAKRSWQGGDNFQSSTTKYGIPTVSTVYVVDIGHKCVATELPEVLPQFTADEVDSILNDLSSCV